MNLTSKKTFLLVPKCLSRYVIPPSGTLLSLRDAVPIDYVEVTDLFANHVVFLASGDRIDKTSASSYIYAADLTQVFQTSSKQFP